MKKIILTFFIISLIILLIKNKIETFDMGDCSYNGELTEEDIYNCKLKAELEKFGLLTDKDVITESIDNIITQIQDYFIQLYINHIEHQLRCIIIIIPGSFDGHEIQIISKKGDGGDIIKISDYMKPIDNPRSYELLIPEDDEDEEEKKKRMTSITLNNVNHIEKIIIGLGFKLAISQPKGVISNKDLCQTQNQYPAGETGGGVCIPKNIFDLPNYFRGNEYYDFMEINTKAGDTKVVEYKLSRWHKKNGYSTNGWKPPPFQYIGGFQFHKKLGPNDTWNCGRSAEPKNCYIAYGDTVHNELIVTIDDDFFDTFYKKILIDSKTPENTDVITNILKNKLLTYKEEFGKNIE